MVRGIGLVSSAFSLYNCAPTVRKFIAKWAVPRWSDKLSMKDLTVYYVIRSASLALFQETPRLRACGYAMHWQRKAPRPSFPRKAESYEQCEKQL
jgi:hypothetical protein